MLTRKLNPQAKAITDCQSEIKALVNRLYLQGRPQAFIENEVRKVIKKYGVKLSNKELQELMPKSMWNLYKQTLLLLFTTFGLNGKQTYERIQVAQTIASGERVYKGMDMPLIAQRYGIPNGIYAKDYMQKVNEVYTRLAKNDALDPDDISGRNSLRNRAEMEVRYEYHQNEIQSFKDAEQNLWFVALMRTARTDVSRGKAKCTVLTERAAKQKTDAVMCRWKRQRTSTTQRKQARPTRTVCSALIAATSCMSTFRGWEYQK